MASRFPATFQAYVYENFGDAPTVLKRREIQQPPLKDTYVRIKVHAAAFNAGDTVIVEAGLAFPLTTTSPTFKNPFRIGFDVAGTVVAVGNHVTSLQVGDTVYGLPQLVEVGSIAEYFDADASGLALKPKNMTFSQAASFPAAALTSFQALMHHAKIQVGDRVLILGGSSGCGAYGIQIAKSMGAYVIATTSARNKELVDSIGADEVIDYTTTNWADEIPRHSIDTIYSCVEPESWNDRAQQVLKQTEGKFVAAAVAKEPLIESPIGAQHSMVFMTAKRTDLEAITELIEAGKLKPVIDSVHSFDHFFDGLKVSMSKRARGKVIVQVIPEIENERKP